LEETERERERETETERSASEEVVILVDVYIVFTSYQQHYSVRVEPSPWSHIIGNHERIECMDIDGKE
jgi:hypothetical protein